MDRKALLTILITAGVMLGWHFGYYAPRAEKNRKAIEAFQEAGLRWFISSTD